MKKLTFVEWVLVAVIAANAAIRLTQWRSRCAAVWKFFEAGRL